MRFRRNLIYFIIQLFIDEKKDRNDHRYLSMRKIKKKKNKVKYGRIIR